jgi:glycosyltransferase involved in cell wall biosynthesis
MPQEEDFGIAPLEAQACGRPVVAFHSGGALETVIDGETGVFFAEQTADSLVEAVERFQTMQFDPERCRENAETFSIDSFKQKFGDYVEMRWQEHVGGGSGG